jgi:hypothetical protein
MIDTAGEVGDKEMKSPPEKLTMHEPSKGLNDSNAMQRLHQDKLVEEFFKEIEKRELESLATGQDCSLDSIS